MISAGPTLRFTDSGTSQDVDPQQGAWPKNINPNTMNLSYNPNTRNIVFGPNKPNYGGRMIYTGPSSFAGTPRTYGGGNGITGGMYSNSGSIGMGGGGSPYEGTYGYGGYGGQMYGQTPNWGGFTPTIGRGAATPGLGYGGGLWNAYRNQGMGMNRGQGMGYGMNRGMGGGMNYGGGMNNQGIGQGTGSGGMSVGGNRFQNLFY